MRKVNEELTKFMFDHGYRNSLVEDKLKRSPQFDFHGIDYGQPFNCRPFINALGNIEPPLHDSPAFHLSDPDQSKLVMVWSFYSSRESFKNFRLRAMRYAYDFNKNSKNIDEAHKVDPVIINNIRHIVVLIYPIEDYIDLKLKQVYKHDFIRDRGLIMKHYDYLVTSF